MTNLLNAVSIFGHQLDWEIDTALFWLLVAQVALILFMVIVFAVLLHRVGQNKTNTVIINGSKEKDMLKAEPADEYYPSEIIYDEMPKAEPAPIVEQPTVVEEPVAEAPVETHTEPVVQEEEPKTQEEVAADAAPLEQEVVEPAPIVVVSKPEPIVVEEESFEGGTLRYDRSFTARIIQADDDQKNWYTEIKNELLSYKKVHDRVSWKRESYNVGRSMVARIAFRGLTLCLYLPLNAAELADSKYKVEAIEGNASFDDTPCLYRIKNAKRVRYAKELIAMVMENCGAEREERESVDYYLPYEGTVELINKGLIKRNIRSKKDEAFFTQPEEEQQ